MGCFITCIIKKYTGVAEVSVMFLMYYRGKGIGKKLLTELVTFSESNIWTLQASIFPENIASIELHKSCGFREVGIRKKLR
jgi:phosphinothricin acetyltransferase